jgi:hypothetical protein
MRLPAEWSQLLANSATEYCYLIEHLDQVNGNWLDNLSSLLPRIHAAMSAIPEQQINTCPCNPDMDLDLRFELYTRLRKLLGDHDGYVLDFDKPEEIDDMSGSLADDFTDIYFELKKGLELLGSDPNALTRAVDLWYGGYLWHWGQHLVDAERHLYDLQVHRCLGANSLIV